MVDRRDIDRLIKEIDRALLVLPRNDEKLLRWALSLASEAARTPPGDKRNELVHEARILVRKGRR
jgi:hypothetical protein